MSNNKTARRDYIDIMKGLGILLVVLGHFMEQFRFGFKPIGATFICIYLFHMALFCICSGLVAHFSLWKLITQQVWLYAVGQAIMLAFRAVILREDFAASGGLLLEALGCVCLLASAPVSKTFDAVANVWYRLRKK